jgi:hypothetical protein
MSKSRPSLILERAAREALAPLGVSQMGRTRTWLDDRRWYAIFVDFEPSDFSQGSYLSIGINWLWSEKDYWAFDVGHRVTDYVEYESDAQFEPEAERLATRAAREVTRYRARFATAAHAAAPPRRVAGWWLGLLGALPRRRGARAARAPLARRLALPPLLRGRPRWRSGLGN